jgi:hypothetical protein
MKKYLLTIAFCLTLFTVSVSAQEVCISQEAANKCAELAESGKAQTDKIALLEEALRGRDKIIDELRIKFAMEGQRATDAEAHNMKLVALMEALLKSYTKPKKWGIIVF